MKSINYSLFNFYAFLFVSVIFVHNSAHCQINSTGKALSAAKITIHDVSSNIILPDVRNFPNFLKASAYDEDLKIQKELISNQPPEVFYNNYDDCFGRNLPFIDSIFVTDPDLFRSDTLEELTLTPLSPSNLQLSAYSIKGPVLDKNGNAVLDSNFKIYFSMNVLNLQRLTDNRGLIQINITDKDGHTVTFSSNVRFSEPTNWVAPLNIKNSYGDKKILHFGYAKDATTGDGNDGTTLGTLDETYCEYSIPEKTDNKIFDARWNFPQTTGTDYNIQPYYKNYSSSIFNSFLCTINPGHPDNDSNTIYVSWNSSDIPSVDNYQRNPSRLKWVIQDAFSNGNNFNYDMKTGSGFPVNDSLNISVIKNNGIITLVIKKSIFDFFVIKSEFTTDDCTCDPINYITYLYPNPVYSTATIHYYSESGKQVKLELFDLLGSKIKTVYQDINKDSGEVNLDIDFTGYLPGIYYLRVDSGNKIEYLKIVKI